MPDGTVIKSGDAGPAVNLRAAKDGGKDFVGAVDCEAYGRRVDFNDLGFMPRQNLVRRRTPSSSTAPSSPGAPRWRRTPGSTSPSRTTSTGRTSRASCRVYNFTRFKNFWGMYTEVARAPAALGRSRGGRRRRAPARRALRLRGLARHRLAQARLGASSGRRRTSSRTASCFQGDGAGLAQGAARSGTSICSPTGSTPSGEPRYFGTPGLRLPLRPPARPEPQHDLALHLHVHPAAHPPGLRAGDPRVGALLGLQLPPRRSAQGDADPPLGPAPRRAFGISQNPDFESGDHQREAWSPAGSTASARRSSSSTRTRRTPPRRRASATAPASTSPTSRPRPAEDALLASSRTGGVTMAPGMPCAPGQTLERTRCPAPGSSFTRRRGLG